MTRAQQTISIGLLASSLYLALFLGLIPMPLIIQREIIPILPLWATVSFGAYLLGKLGYGVLTFNDATHAHKELMGQITQARKELEILGVEVD
ncbi:unnamed protein product [Blumeria hordei]|uniref:Dolichol-phosphate mannosyltransferase subunit 3 n=2 Tax=Blumeria hordei TaxID=2867405 RepID=A0A383UKU9_BLUHO|nr:dolichol phosphate mannosyltransferase subunit 3 [Blumeria hordei DH14]SZF00358.1 unnamed protein product [Blumeria hordei]